MSPTDPTSLSPGPRRCWMLLKTTASTRPACTVSPPPPCVLLRISSLHTPWKKCQVQLSAETSFSLSPPS